ncbi:hypothetical protein [Tamlana fucoidanivorans]|uniref:hypothetical protein n=1 Tax=Allotamlana fucoidanivorans TaxID=2583814 RepID=UPI001E2D3A30|nr:hypothetical protein [Tamlana fucoidanivorans]
MPHAFGYSVFLGYDIDEELPWHSAIIRTRVLFPESVFEDVFTKVFELCVSAGMVSGHTQAIDSAPVKAKRQSAVEPVFGTLTQFWDLEKSIP